MMRIYLRMPALFIAALCAASFCSAAEWEEFVGSQKVELLNSIRSYPATFYVSLDGNDEWSGRLAEPNTEKTDGPFKSFQKAQRTVQVYRSSAEFDGQPTVVEVCPGTYELESDIQFTAADSGTENAPVIWRGTCSKTDANKPVTLLRAGRSLKGSVPVTDESVRNRLKEEVRDKILQIDLKALGIEDYGTLDGKDNVELFVNDEPMMISRYPNAGFVKFNEVVYDGNETFALDDTRGVVHGKIIYDDDTDHSVWNQEKEIWTLGYWCWDWANSRQRIAKLDTDRRMIELAEPDHGYGYRAGQYFYAYNLLCEVDMPGEFYVDRDKGILYFYPPEGFDERNLFLSHLLKAAEGNDLQHFVFSGFLLDGCRGDTLRFNGNDITICGCLIRNCGARGIILNGSNNLAFGNHLYNLGGSGILLTAGDRGNLIEGKSAAVNNDVHHYGRIARVYSPGIGLSGCGILVSQNRIAEAPHCGMMFEGNENRIEFNEVSMVCKETNDAGAVYGGRDWTQRGNLIRYNYLHDITGFENRGCVGVYLDDMFSSADIIGNLFVRMATAVLIGGGRDNSLINNFFVECETTMQIDARAFDGKNVHANRWLEEERTRSTISGIDYKSELWSKKYPKLRAILDGNPNAPEGNTVARNAVIYRAWHQIQPAFYDATSDALIDDTARQYLTIEDNVIGDYRLLILLNKTPVSEMPNNGVKFERIPVERIGLFGHSAAVSRVK